MWFFDFWIKRKFGLIFLQLSFFEIKTLFCHFGEGFSPFADFCTHTYIHMSYCSIQDTTIFVTKSERMTFGCLELCIRVIVPAYESQQIHISISFNLQHRTHENFTICNNSEIENQIVCQQRINKLFLVPEMLQEEQL